MEKTREEKSEGYNLVLNSLLDVSQRHGNDNMIRE